MAGASQRSQSGCAAEGHARGENFAARFEPCWRTQARPRRLDLHTGEVHTRLQDFNCRRQPAQELVQSPPRLRNSASATFSLIPTCRRCPRLRAGLGRQICGPCSASFCLEHFPIRWNRIGCSNVLLSQHILIEKVRNFFGSCASRATKKPANWPAFSCVASSFAQPALKRLQAALARGEISLRLTRTSAIWMALSAAPLRRLSLTHQKARPFSTVASSRMREM